MTLLSIITRSPNAWLLYGYLLHKSNGGKELVTIPIRELASAVNLSLQQCRTALKFLLDNTILTQVSTQGATQTKTLQVSDNVVRKALGLRPSNTTSNTMSNTKSTQSKATVPNASSVSPSRFTPPTLQQVAEFYIAYATSRGVWKDFSPETFVSFYEANNWNLSTGKPMRDWQKAITGTWLPSPKRTIITEQQWRLFYNNEKSAVALGVGEYLDSNGNRRYKLSNGYTTQTYVPLSAPPRANYEQLWSSTTNKWYYE